MIEMTEVDIISAALCSWKEARGGGVPGMTSVINVLLNRAAKNKRSVYAEVYDPFQFSSMSYAHDPQLLKQPVPSDPQWQIAVTLAISASTGALEDITNGSTHYYALSMVKPPSWAERMTPTAIIGGQQFLRA